MRTWQVERRKRTRHLIELGGLVVKAGIVDLTSDGSCEQASSRFCACLR